MTKMVATSPRK